ncbi:MAG: polysaccharide deacetylase family protein [Bacteroidales bacterium]|nr:polysaccharide deacetylase family protein [Bacteroidales bacterium]
MNILTFDIEEWYIEKHFGADRPECYLKYDECLDRILDKLDERNLKATFFVVGAMAREFPDVVKLISARGHEVGCHSDSHIWLGRMTPEECREDTRRAVDSLEQCIGKKVLSYRAPAFSIGKSNDWAFGILAENGIERDSSVYPALRDFGGFENFGPQKPTLIDAGGIRIKEFPIPLMKVFGRQFAYSGGGYFRLMPYSLVKRKLAQTDYGMTYFHISDLLPDRTPVPGRKEYEEYYGERGSLANRCKRHFKDNFGRDGALAKMIALLEDFEFVNIEEVSETIA